MRMRMRMGTRMRTSMSMRMRRRRTRMRMRMRMIVATRNGRKSRRGEEGGEDVEKEGMGRLKMSCLSNYHGYLSTVFPP